MPVKIYSMKRAFAPNADIALNNFYSFMPVAMDFPYIGPVLVNFFTPTYRTSLRSPAVTHVYLMVYLMVDRKR